MEIIKKFISENQYYKVEQPKKILVLHHTVSGVGVDGDINWWEKTPEKVGTPFIIARDGKIYQTFDEKYWIHHLGIKQWMLDKFKSGVSNDRLNQLSIGIELDSWGGLILKDGKWLNGAGAEMKKEDIVVYDKEFRGFKAFERYSNAQIESARRLLIFLGTKYGIDLNYNDQIFDFNDKALKGFHGVWSHVSYRPDKSDCHPQTELISMLKGLK